MNFSENTHLRTLIINSIEGTPTTGPFDVKTLLKGDHLSLLEVHLHAGVASSSHIHSHESLIYLVSGKLKTTIGGETYILGPGDACRHPDQVPHSVEALEETLFVEIKSPAPDVAKVMAP